MHPIIFLCTTLLTLELHAMEIKIKYNNFNSTIVSDKKLISYKDVTTTLTLKDSKCTSHILQRLSKDLSKKSQNLLQEKVADHPMTITIDKHEDTIDQRSPKGQFFYNYIDVMKQAKIEESLNCP